MQSGKTAMINTLLCISIAVFLFTFGCATVKQGYEDVTQKAKDAFSDEKEQQPAAGCTSTIR